MWLLDVGKCAAYSRTLTYPTSRASAGTPSTWLTLPLALTRTLTLTLTRRTLTCESRHAEYMAVRSPWAVRSSDERRKKASG